MLKSSFYRDIVHELCLLAESTGEFLDYVDLLKTALDNNKMSEDQFIQLVLKSEKCGSSLVRKV